VLDQKWLENHEIYHLEAAEYVAPGISTLRTSPRMEVPLIEGYLPYYWFSLLCCPCSLSQNQNEHFFSSGKSSKCKIDIFLRFAKEAIFDIF
jgi:hypothetical protein